MATYNNVGDDTYNYVDDYLIPNRNQPQEETTLTNTEYTGNRQPSPQEYIGEFAWQALPSLPTSALYCLINYFKGVNSNEIITNGKTGSHCPLANVCVGERLLESQLVPSMM